MTVNGWRKYEKCIKVTFSGWRLHKNLFLQLSPDGDCIKNHLRGFLRMETA